jgi:choice-of-anchor B domain-containing protein
VYVGVDGATAGMQVMDLTKLRAYQGTTLNLTANTVYNNVTKIHTLAINPDSGYLYADGTKSESSGLGGMHIINVSNPNAPAFVTEYNGDNYTHESQVVTYHGPDAAYQGKEIAFNSNGKSSSTNDTFSIVDLSNKAAITRIASKSYPNAKFIHQGWLTEDQKYFFQNDELDEDLGVTGGHTRTHLWDVQDLDNPVYKGFYEHQGGAIDHNLYTKGGFLFETNYTQGLRMLKIGDLSSSNPTDWLQEVAYYDTYAPTDSDTFNGAWNNYPFFKSGNIVVSDIEGGLFVIQPRVNGWKLGAAGPTGGNGGNTGAGGLSVPEPASAAILLGALALGAMRRRSR